VPKLKIGLLMDSFDVPYWIYKVKGNNKKIKLLISASSSKILHYFCVFS